MALTDWSSPQIQTVGREKGAVASVAFQIAPSFQSIRGVGGGKARHRHVLLGCQASTLFPVSGETPWHPLSRQPEVGGRQSQQLLWIKPGYLVVGGGGGGVRTEPTGEPSGRARREVPAPDACGNPKKNKTKRAAPGQWSFTPSEKNQESFEGWPARPFLPFRGARE
jgi:hypothetical protein